jgi:hypothetical protein
MSRTRQGISRPAAAGIVFVAAVIAMIAYMSFNLAHKGVRAEVCMQYNGLTNCKTVSGDSREHVVQTAISGACADIVSGVTETIQCEHSTPKSITWK